jgi:ubiquinone/menaquinone biosynthesis C-methylase UbiE
MKFQKKIFIDGEGDQWHLRNNKSQSSEDIILTCLKRLEISPQSILEIGCSSGVRLGKLSSAFNASCFGVDPSAKAIEEGSKSFPELTLKVGTADELTFSDQNFDLIIFGFCLYLCDRRDLFKIAYEADRCLKDNGYLVIIDFEPPFAYKNSYVHHPDVFSYKMNYGNMFAWNPAYVEIYNELFSHSGYQNRNIPNERISIKCFQKNTDTAFVLNPYRADD